MAAIGVGLWIVFAGKVGAAWRSMNWEELRARAGSHFWVKGIGSTVAIGLFFVAYFFVLRHPVAAVREVPLLELDQWAPVLPWSVWAYFSLWVYICLPEALIKNVSVLRHYLLGAAVLAGVGLLIFTVWPTAVPVWEVDWSAYPALAFLKATDATGNACPSLHVAFAVFSGLWLGTLLRRLEARAAWHWGNGFWCLAIVGSTLTTKQHVFWDVFSGALLGAVVFVGNRWWLKRGGVTI